VTRKLAAILVADVVGYSRLAGADEERTLARPAPTDTLTISTRADAARRVSRGQPPPDWRDAGNGALKKRLTESALGRDRSPALANSCRGPDGRRGPPNRHD
jgi:hypothetical protein